MSKFLTISLIIVLSALHTTAQKRSAQKLYDEALTRVNQQEAIILFQKAIAKDSTYTEAYLNLARQYESDQNYDLQVEALYIASQLCERKTTLLFAQLSKAAYRNGDYMMAWNAINQIEAEYDNQLTHLKRNIEFSLTAISQPYDFDAVNLGQEANTEHHDYWPSLSIDEQQIVTTVFVDSENDEVLNTAQEDLFYSRREGNQWSEAKPMSKIINSLRNEGAQTLSADGSTMLFTACNRFDGIGACDIYMAYQVNGVWSPPIPLPSPLNTTAWEGHPSLSANGKELFFSSNRDGGYGGRDLYVASIKLGLTIEIGEITNLGAEINTDQHEISPFIHPDGKTLYFSSDGHLGLGRQDIFYAMRDSSGFTEKPKNFGFPINTHHDEIGLVVNAQGNRGYFSAERDSSRKKDIYSFELPQETQATTVTYINASIEDEQTGRSLEGNVEISLTSTGELIYEKSSTRGFTIPLQFNDEYAVHVSHAGYLLYSDHISLDQQSKTPYQKKILLAPVASGSKVVLENILFQLNSYELDTNYTAELDKAIELIKRNPKFQFEISGHTDNIGTVKYNLKLSEQRAQAVYDYFITKGIKSSRLSYIGYGQSRPISDKNIENRRTELLVK